MAPPLRRITDEAADHGPRHGTDRSADQRARDGAGPDPECRPTLRLGRPGRSQRADEDEGDQNFTHDRDSTVRDLNTGCL